jgi:hypothetical protein
VNTINDPFTNEPAHNAFCFSIEDGSPTILAPDIDWPDGAPVPESVDETIDR